MNLLKIELPKLETLVASLNHILERVDSEYVAEFEIESAQLPRAGRSSMLHKQLYTIHIGAQINIGKLKDLANQKYEKYQTYKFQFEIPDLQWDKNEVKVCNQIDNQWFTEFLTGILHMKDNEYKHQPFETIPKCISLDTLLNIRKDDNTNTN